MNLKIRALDKINFCVNSIELFDNNLSYGEKR